MSENKLWLYFWVICGVVIMTAIIGGYLYSNAENKYMTAMVEAGANPIDARCALEDELGDDPVCVIQAHNLNK